MTLNPKHLHVIGIWGIGVSALARYYKANGYSVSGSDGADSAFLDTLRSEGFDISIGHSESHLRDDTDLVIYSEAIITKPDLPLEEQIYANPELRRARDLGIRHLSYPVALGEVFNAKKWIAVTGSHGKSTTTAMIATMLAGTSVGASAIVGTQVPQLGNTNFHSEDSENFVIEACEYKRSFLQYKPYITVITNIDLDHLDYYKNLDDYISAFQSIVDQTSGFVIISTLDENSSRLVIPEEKKIVVGARISPLLGKTKEGYPTHLPLQGEEKNQHTNQPTSQPTIIYYPRVEEMCCGEKKIYTVEKTMPLPTLELQVPGDHLLQDAYLAFTVGKLLWLDDTIMVQKLNNYQGSWRRSEIVRTTKNGNILMSDYGHHPSEIVPTLKAIKEKYQDKKLFVVFQPHQYSRTRELLDEFSRAFDSADELVIPDIYFSRDKKEDVEWMTTDRLIGEIKKKKEKRKDTWTDTVINGEWLENTLEIIKNYDRENPNSSVILLLWAGNVDGLRVQIT